MQDDEHGAMRLAWAIGACVLLLAPGLAQADSPTAYPTRVFEYQFGQARRVAGDPVGIAGGAAGAAQQLARTLDPGPVVQGAEAQANATAGQAAGAVLGAAGPLGRDATDLERSAQQKALGFAQGAPGAVGEERAYVNRVLRRFM